MKWAHAVYVCTNSQATESQGGHWGKKKLSGPPVHKPWLSIHLWCILPMVGCVCVEWAQLKVRKASLAGQDSRSPALHFPPRNTAAAGRIVPIPFLQVEHRSNNSGLPPTIFAVSIFLFRPEPSYSRVIHLSLLTTLRPGAVLQTQSQDRGTGNRDWEQDGLWGRSSVHMHASPSLSNIWWQACAHFKKVCSTDQLHTDNSMISVCKILSCSVQNSSSSNHNNLR